MTQAMSDMTTLRSSDARCGDGASPQPSDTRMRTDNVGNGVESCCLNCGFWQHTDLLLLNADITALQRKWPIKSLNGYWSSFGVHARFRVAPMSDELQQHG